MVTPQELLDAIHSRAAEVALARLPELRQEYLPGDVARFAAVFGRNSLDVDVAPVPDRPGFFRVNYGFDCDGRRVAFGQNPLLDDGSVRQLLANLYGRLVRGGLG